jgi:hypothetical protein
MKNNQKHGLGDNPRLQEYINKAQAGLACSDQ